MNNKEDKKKIIIVIITAIAAFVALILLVVGIIVAREIISDVKSQNEYKVQQQKWNFRDDMINRIPGDKDLSSLQDDLRDIVRYVENTSDDNKEDAIVNLGLAYDTGVLDKGKNEYSKFLNYYRLNKHFSEGESSWTFDADRHEFYIGYKVEASGIYSSNPQVCTMVFTFNDAWKLIDIQIVEGYVDSIHNYRQ